MASTNGILSPSPHFDVASSSLNVSAKRKRVENSEALERMNGITDSKATKVSIQQSSDSQQLVDDYIEVLRSRDIFPSILNRQLPVRESSSEPSPKRMKSESFNDVSTIISRARSGVYSTVEDVVADVKAACSAILEEFHLPSGSARMQYTPISPDVSGLASKITVFRQNAEHMVQVQKALNHRRSSKRPDDPVDAATLANGNVSSKGITQLTPSQGANKMVLTLFGNASGSKQLFSSLQESIKTSGGMRDVAQPLREDGIPNGISTTQIFPAHSIGIAEEKKRVSTLGELFTSTTSNLPFQPPKPSRVTTTRATVVGWYQPAGLEAARTRNASSYYGQTISSGQWLDYTGVSASVDPKRKQRERALSLGGVKSSLSSSDLAEQEALKLETLFRSAYSSFAPSKDDAAAIVPAGLTNRMWWQRMGKRSFDRLAKNTTAIEGVLDPNANLMTEQAIGHVEEIEDETEEFKQVVDNWDDQNIDPSLKQTDDMSIEDKEVEEILQGISELLETLNSYQRIRNLSLNQVRPTGAIPTGEPASTPAKPTEAEIATYNTLKSQLTLMIATLPPYAVAKLNSNQLSELSVSTKITLYADSQKGVMEEDEAAARAKVAELRAATNTRTTSSTTIHRSSSSLYGNQYSSTPRSSAPGGQQFYSQSQTPVRPPSTNPQRPPSATPVPYTGQRPQSSTSYRPQPSYATPAYPHQTPRNAQTQYTPSNPQLFQTPTVTNYSQPLSQNYGSAQLSTPQANLSTRYQPPVHGIYQQRSQPQNGLDYRYSNGNSVNHQPSPPKTQAYSPQPHSTQLQNRSFSTPTPTMVQDQRYFQSAALTNGTASLSPQPQIAQQQTQSLSRHLGATGYHTVMTAAEQSTMMERQRAQLAQQQGTQHQARSAAQAGAMSVPPAPQISGGSPVPAGL